MLIREIIERKERGESADEIARLVGYSDRTGLNGQMKRLGFQGDRNTYIWLGEGPPPLDLDVQPGRKFTPSSTSRPTTNIPKSERSHILVQPKTECKHTPVLPFTDQEVEILKKMAGEWGETPTHDPTSSIYDRVRELETGGKVRKTMILTKSTSEAWDVFVKQFKKVEKNAILELALIDFMSRYNEN